MRIKFIIALFLSIWLALIVRVFFLAVESNSYYTKLSHSNTIKSEKIIPVRGEIVDRNNIPLAINKLGFKIKLKPNLRIKKNLKLFNDEIDSLIKLLPNLNREKLIKNYIKKDSYYNHNFIDIVDFISYEEIMPVYSILNLKENIKIVPSPKRYYPYKEIAAHIIGYVARANKKDVENNSLLGLIGYTGKTGIEKYYNNYLQGSPGLRKIKVNANNQEIEELLHIGADEDRKLTLSIDIKLQKYISKLLKNQEGAVIVMDVNGSILSASSFPEYSLNTFVSGISYEMWDKLSTSLEKPFTNKITHGLYPPGSTIKIGLGLLYITTKMTPKQKFYCVAKLPIGNRVFRCWKKRGHHSTDVTKAIRESCDDFFYKGGLLLGVEKMREGLMRYGLGKRTGIDLPNEFVGTIPSISWKRKKYNRPWNIGETLNTSIGQGDVLTSPIQIAQYTALMATGRLPTPHIAKKIGDAVVKDKFKEVLTKDELEKLPIIQKAMIQVCNYPSGTAMQYLRLNKKIKIAGKTGTAQVIKIKQDIKKRRMEHQLSHYNRSHAWFTSYGPYKNPQYVVLVMIEHGGHGGFAAGKIVSKIYNKLYELKYLKP